MKIHFKLLTILAVSFAPAISRAQTVTLDYYFNHEVHKGADGKDERFHYLWEEKDMNGYSNWGKAFVKEGAQLKSLETAPAAANLTGTDIYIIVDPDSKKESPSPNYIMPKDVEHITQFVKNGGVLVMMANDSANVELPHINMLAAKFGMHFTNELHNHVTGSIQPGTMMVEGNPLFKTAKRIYMKDVCSIALYGPAKPLLQNEGVTIIATAKYGKGTVFAVGDPWLYNEYTNGHLPADGHYDNDKAVTDVTQWLLQQVPVKK